MNVAGKFQLPPDPRHGCEPLPRVARFLAAKYGRLLSIHDVRQGQYDAIS